MLVFALWLARLTNGVFEAGLRHVSQRNDPEDWWANNGGQPWVGNRGPMASVNFITAHDGFTMRDLVSYNEKKNMANGESNRCVH